MDGARSVRLEGIGDIGMVNARFAVMGGRDGGFGRQTIAPGLVTIFGRNSLELRVKAL